MRILILCLFYSVNILADHGYTPFASLKYTADDACFSYVYAEAPKGGKITIGVVGTFDTVNPLDFVGKADRYLSLSLGKLMSQAVDEPLSLYPQIAKNIDVKDDYVTFSIDPRARWNNGKRVTSHDIRDSFVLWGQKGTPLQRNIFAQIEATTVPTLETITFKLSSDVPYKPQLIAFLSMMPIIKKMSDQYVSCGPYTIESYRLGDYIKFTRVIDYWAQDIMAQKGRFNFDEIVVKYYKNAFALVEALRKGKVDVCFNLSPESIRQLKSFSSDIYLVEQEQTRPVGMSGLIFNLRHPFFVHQDVRQAMYLLFDFDWFNQVALDGQAKKINSFFENTPYAYPEYLPWEKAMQWPERLDKARHLLAKAGWEMKDGRLYHQVLNRYFDFTILLPSKTHKALVQEFVRRLSSVGIKANIYILSDIDFAQKKSTFSFDMAFHQWPTQHLPNYNLQGHFMGQYAHTKGGKNYIGLCNSEVDQLIRSISQTYDIKTLMKKGQILDKILREEIITIPFYYSKKHVIASSKKFGYPEDSAVGAFISSWWAYNETEGSSDHVTQDSKTRISHS